MATIEERLRNVRTLEDIINLLTILFTNMNNQNNLYYDMFLNPEPLTLELERYNDDGELEKVSLDNRAKDRIWMQMGSGSPIGEVTADPGTFYLDVTNKVLYFKASGSDSENWVFVWAENNLIPDNDFLRPDGDGSQLKNLNAEEIKLGLLPVGNGGTGVSTITGLVKGNGTSAFSSAEPNVDYLAPDELVGMIMWSPAETINGRWLVCDGSSYPRTGEYTALFNKIGTKYGSDSESTFKVPNLIGRYVKGGTFANVGNTGNASVGAHSHSVIGSIGTESAHTHGGGSLGVSESYLKFALRRSQTVPSSQGAFDLTPEELYRGDADGDGNRLSWRATLNLAGKWDGATGSGSPHTHSFSGTASSSGGSTEVDHMVLVPVIRY